MKRIITLLLTCAILTVLCAGVAAESPIEVTAPSAILIEKLSGRVLFEKNADEQRPIASVTKVMTALLVMEAIARGEMDYSDMVTTSELAYSMGGSQIYLEVGEQMSVDDMLKALMVASGNDAAVALAEHTAGNYQIFVERMNGRAAELGMQNTHFMNANGLDEDGHYSSARDVAIASMELMKHEKITEYTTIWMDSLRGGEFQLANTNKLIRSYDGATGLKTGFTSLSMHCLSAAASRNDLDLIAVVLASPTSQDRFNDAAKLLDYGFNGFTIKEGIKQGDVVGQAEVKRGKIKMINAVAAQNFSLLEEKNAKGDINKIIDIPETIEAPVEQGQIIGKLFFEKDGQELGSVDLIADRPVPRKGYFDILSGFLGKWLGVVVAE